jgi:hypothetical protein
MENCILSKSPWIVMENVPVVGTHNIVAILDLYEHVTYQR